MNVAVARYDVSQFINQYSYVIVAVILVLASAAIAYLWLPLPVGWLLVAAVVVFFAILHRILRFRAPNPANADEVSALIGAGWPVMVVVYSNY